MPACVMCMLGPEMGGRMYHSSIANICKCPVCHRTNWQFNQMLDRLWDCENYIKINQAKFSPEMLKTLANMVDSAETLANAARTSFQNKALTAEIWIKHRDDVYREIANVLHYAGVTP